MDIERAWVETERGGVIVGSNSKWSHEGGKPNQDYLNVQYQCVCLICTMYNITCIYYTTNIDTAVLLSESDKFTHTHTLFSCVSCFCG